MDKENLSGEKALIEERRKKLEQLRDKGDAYGNSFKPKNNASKLHEEYGVFSKEDLEKKDIKNISVAGRIVLKRVMGNASFATLRDSSGDIQIYVTKNNVDESVYEDFKTWDLGDIVGVSGSLFRTKTDELTIDVWDLEMITKSLRPMPEKFKGLTDIEARYRQRYLDLMTNNETKEVFVKRTKIIDSMRKKMNECGYLEVETPMMHPLAGGAVARPFVTQHNALGQDLYLRIAPELYLKRLLVGGFDRVFEINRNFRNEGLSTIHNPEFTMLEFYEAYGSLDRTTRFVQKLVQDSISAVNDSLSIIYEDKELNLESDFEVKSLKDLVQEKLNMALDTEKQIFDAAKKTGLKVKSDWGWGKVLLELFEEHVEKNLWNPTFVKDYPYEVSPLSRRKNENKDYTDRIELFIAGREFANFFCELNDPTDQEERFTQQVKQKDSGDEEACLLYTSPSPRDRQKSRMPSSA